MNKGLIATITVSVLISVMLLMLTDRVCSFSLLDRTPWTAGGCWLFDKLSLSDAFEEEALWNASEREQMTHPGQINTWSQRLELEETALFLSMQEAPFDASLARRLAELAIVTPQCDLGVTAVQALGKGTEEHVLEVLESIALSASCLCIRKEAIRQIEHFGSEQARSVLITILWKVTS